jgi:glycosyltransferase involved in cell wall biosynthesis
MTPRKLLTIGHSYVVGVNRRPADALAASGEWDVTVVAPSEFRGDFAWHEAAPLPGEACRLAPVPVHFAGRVHTMLYGRELSRLLRGERWDLVHVWEEPYVAAAAQVAAAAPAELPLVFATFQNISKRYPPPFNWFERYALRRADGIVAFGATAAGVLAERGYPAERTAIIPPGVDVRRFSPNPHARSATRAALGWTDEAPVVGFLGRLVPEKGIATLMAALDGLTIPWRALIVGAGPLEQLVRDWSARHHGRVVLRTDVQHEGVPEWLNAMDVLCAPSRATPAWREQFGRMIVEAFACGVPVVASTSGEIPHVVGDAGVLVGEDDVEGWRRAVSSLLTDAAHRADLSRRGRERAAGTYDWPLIARAHARFFERVIAAAAGGPLTIDRQAAAC